MFAFGKQRHGGQLHRGAGSAAAHASPLGVGARGRRVCSSLRRSAPLPARIAARADCSVRRQVE